MGLTGADVSTELVASEGITNLIGSYMLRWYLVHTKPRREAIAAQNLERQNYAVYLPMVQQPARRRNGWRDQIMPLFPRYLFTQVDEGHQSIGPIRSTLGVSQIVQNGSNIAIVPDQIVTELRERADAQSGFHSLSQPATFEPGLPVKVAAGPFTGLEGVFQCHSGSDRIVVLLNVLGKSTRVRLPHGFVTPSHAAC